MYKPLQKQAPQKGPLKNISPGAYFRNFTVCSRYVHIIGSLEQASHSQSFNKKLS